MNLKYISTRDASIAVSFHEAMFQGLAPDGGLYIPESIPTLSHSFVSNLTEVTLVELAETILQPYLTEVPAKDLNTIIINSLNFTVPLIKLEDDLFLLEVFHGPTMAFKDMGARFMANMVAYYLQQRDKKLTILVATSGDTGSAIAHAFHRIPHVEVYVLYPSKKISFLQEQQMTTLGDNIHALEVNGTFDDCQQLVKKALLDDELRKLHDLSTANSINIARLLPQIVYHSWGVAQYMRMKDLPSPDMVVPSGNFGNLTAAIYANKMGVPIQHFIAATNINAIVPAYLATGIFSPQPSLQSLSNAMDVGNPSNFERLLALYGGDHAAMQQAISGISVKDEETLKEIRDTYTKHHYILDPHTAVGVVAAREYRRQHVNSHPAIITATAHPAKFPEVIKRAINVDMELPQQLQEVMQRKKQTEKISTEFNLFKTLLMRER